MNRYLSYFVLFLDKLRCTKSNEPQNGLYNQFELISDTSNLYVNKLALDHSIL
jgi:hypothetical protein